MFWSICFVAILVFLIAWKIKTGCNYWSSRGVIQPTVSEQLMGNLSFFSRRIGLADLIKMFYNRFPNNRYAGMYNFFTPILVIRDPELIKQIFVKDFEHFTDHINLMPPDHEVLWNKNLMALKGDQWRQMRATISPAFTSSKMKAMFVLMAKTTEQFVSYFENQEEPIEVDLKDVFTKFVNDVIATCAFGIECNSLEDPKNPFYLAGKDITDFNSFLKGIKFTILLVMPKLAKFLGLKFFPQEVTAFFTQLIRDNVRMREEKNIIRPDLIHLLMEARKGQLLHEESGSSEGFAAVEGEWQTTDKKRQGPQEITEVDMTAHALSFFFAGFDSVSTLMCFLGYELSVNPEIQERLREEIDVAMEKCGGKMDYETINKLKYLDMVVSETLRKWPSTAATERVCTKPYTIEPKESGELALHLDKDCPVLLATYGIHYDPEIYPDPDRFDPERFGEENRKRITPYNFVPFGIGPRACVGSRFALLKTKIVYCQLLSKFELVVTENTQVPIQFKKGTFTISTERGYWVGFKKRKQH